MPDISLKELSQRVRECNRCPARRRCKRSIAGVGRGRAKVMLVSPAPSKEEDWEGLGHVGSSGQWTSALLNYIGLHDRDIYFTYLQRCYPGRMKNGQDFAPAAYAIKACGQWLEKEMAIVEYELIVAVGAVVMKWFGIKGGVKQNQGKTFDTKYGRVLVVLNVADINKRMVEAPQYATSLRAIHAQLADPVRVPPYVEDW